MHAWILLLCTPLAFQCPALCRAPCTSPVRMRGCERRVLLHGGSLRTWSLTPAVEQAHLVLRTTGGPLDVNVDLWSSPNHRPCKMRVFSDNGMLHPFNAAVETPRGANDIAVHNIGKTKSPVAARVTPSNIDIFSIASASASTVIHGGGLRSYAFEGLVDSVNVLLRTDGCPLNARIEVLQGADNTKQVVELYTEDGLDRPFSCVLPTPGSGHVARIVNTAPAEFTLIAHVFPKLLYKKNMVASCGVCIR